VAWKTPRRLRDDESRAMLAPFNCRSFASSVLAPPSPPPGHGGFLLRWVGSRSAKLKGASRLDGTLEENKAAIAGTVAAFGTWSLDEATNTRVTSVEGSLFPNDEGGDQRRIIALAGDELKIVNPSPGSGGRAEIVFKRAK
jgi:hypothetical protein